MIYLDILVGVILIATVLFVQLFAWLNTSHVERPHTRESAQETRDRIVSRHALTGADRDMVYETPKWWDQEFHKALAALPGTPRVVVDTAMVEESTMMGISTRYAIEYSYLSDCTCSACATVRSMA